MQNKFASILLAGLSLCGFAMAQSTVLEIELPPAENFDPPLVRTLQAGDNQLGLFIFNDDQINSFLIDSTYKIVSQFTFPTPAGFKAERLDGSAFSNNNFTFYYAHEKKPQYKYLIISIENLIYKGGEINIEFKKKDPVVSFSADNQFFIIGPSEGNFLIHRFTTANVYESLSYSVNNITAYDIDKDGMIRGFDCGYEKQGLAYSSAPTKFYYWMNKIYLVLDGEQRAAEVIAFDLENKQADYNLFGANMIFKEGTGEMKTNSAFFRGKLFKATKTQDWLQLQIFDVETGEELKDFKCTKDEEIPFKNTPIQRDKNGWIGEIKKTKRFLRHLPKGDLSVAVNENLIGWWEVEVGVVEAVKGSAYTPLFMDDGMPVRSGFSYAERYNYASFKSVFDENTLKHIPGQLNEDRIKLYQNIKEAIESTVVQQFNNVYLFGYRKNRKYYLVEFR